LVADKVVGQGGQEFGLIRDAQVGLGDALGGDFEAAKSQHNLDGLVEPTVQKDFATLILKTVFTI
jgi:hypothetical protein